MFIRLFAYADSECSAKIVANNTLNSISKSINSMEYVTCEPYWKMDGVYKIEMKVVLEDQLTDSQFHDFMDDVSDKWLFYGSPTDELLASDTTEGCNYIKRGVSLINVFLND